LIDTITHAFEVFRTPDIILKETPIVERSGLKHVPLDEPIDTTSEQPTKDI
jgi:hypothetical protein